MKKLRIILQSKIFYITLLLLVLGISFVRIKLDNRSIYSADDTLLEGTILNYNFDGNKLSMLVDGKENVQATYYINSESELKKLEEKVKYGYKLIASGTFKIPTNNTIPNTFNYKKYLNNKDIYFTLSIDNLEIIPEEKGLYSLKNFIVSRINKNEATKDYLYTFILGDKSYLDYDTYLKYQTNGVVHLFAISGMHISLFSAILLVLLRKFNDFVKYTAINIFLFVYGFITLFPASILRAGIFFFINSLNKVFKLKLEPICILVITVVINLIINPKIIFDIGFLYSVSTVGGIILFTEFISEGNYFIRLIKTSLVANVFSLPITLYSFYSINLLSIISNLIFIPLVTFIIYPLCLLTLIAPTLSGILSIFINLGEFLNNLFYSIDFFNVIIPLNNLGYVVVYYLLLFGYYFLKNKKFICLIIIVFLFAKFNYIFDSSTYVYFLDVGQGDSTLIISPRRNKIIMIDTGGKIGYQIEDWKTRRREYKLSDNTLAFLKSLGITKIDFLILSHGDYDHMGEAINLVDNFKVEKVIFNNNEYNDLELELIKVLKDKNIPYYQNIKELNIDNNKLYFLNDELYDNENDSSNVIFTELNNHKFLFMGDAGIEVEEDILEKYNLNDINTLKVGHHGSKTSSSEEFVDSIDPKYSIISVGKNNRYGHPNDNVLDNLKKSKIYRTDQDGSVMFKIKNNKLEIKTCTP